ncbi:MAG: GntG family PLP-dependent aldolase [Balneolaceae bacterium]
MVDLRSDTVTKPTKGMLDAMVCTEVGDDVFAEDPTVNEFERKMAELFGMEAGLFVPSGTMSNQLCIKVLTEPGDEVLIDATGHPFNYETGAAAHLSSVQLNPLQGVRGKLTPELIESAIRPKNNWDPRSRMIAVENSTNKGGGACYSREELQDLKEIADQHDLYVHLDGARIWNAITATGIEPEFFGTISDTLSVCFSKGLGAPVGSMMLSSADFITKARRYRKMWGGGMRQVGLLAAAADYGVENHWPLMEDDHRRTKLLAEAISDISGFSVNPGSVETNIVLFNVEIGSVDEVLKRLKEKGVGMVPFGPKTIRAVFHFQVDDEGLDRAIKALGNSVSVSRGAGNGT